MAFVGHPILDEIRQGRRLRPTQTVDKSAPLILADGERIGRKGTENGGSASVQPQSVPSPRAPPPPPILRSATSSPAAGSLLEKRTAVDRDRLLEGIRGGVRLRKVVTNDKSAPVIDSDRSEQGAPQHSAPSFPHPSASGPATSTPLIEGLKARSSPQYGSASDGSDTEMRTYMSPASSSAFRSASPQYSEAPPIPPPPPPENPKERDIPVDAAFNEDDLFVTEYDLKKAIPSGKAAAVRALFDASPAPSDSAPSVPRKLSLNSYLRPECEMRPQGPPDAAFDETALKVTEEVLRKEIPNGSAQEKIARFASGTAGNSNNTLPRIRFKPGQIRSPFHENSSPGDGTMPRGAVRKEGNELGWQGTSNGNKVLDVQQQPVFDRSRQLPSPGSSIRSSSTSRLATPTFARNLWAEPESGRSTPTRATPTNAWTDQGRTAFLSASRAPPNGPGIVHSSSAYNSDDPGRSTPSATPTIVPNAQTNWAGPRRFVASNSPNAHFQRAASQQPTSSFVQNAQAKYEEPPRTGTPTIVPNPPNAHLERAELQRATPTQTCADQWSGRETPRQIVYAVQNGHPRAPSADDPAVRSGGSRPEWRVQAEGAGHRSRLESLASGAGSAGDRYWMGSSSGYFGSQPTLAPSSSAALPTSAFPSSSPSTSVSYTPIQFNTLNRQRANASHQRSNSEVGRPILVRTDFLPCSDRSLEPSPASPLRPLEIRDAQTSPLAPSVRTSLPYTYRLSSDSGSGKTYGGISKDTVTGRAGSPQSSMSSQQSPSSLSPGSSSPQDSRNNNTIKADSYHKQGSAPPPQQSRTISVPISAPWHAASPSLSQGVARRVVVGADELRHMNPESIRGNYQFNIDLNSDTPLSISRR